MQYIKPSLNDFQISNLKRLAAHLDLGVTNYEFGMGSFLLDEEAHNLSPQQHACGTVGCALGHGPALGIEPLSYESWGTYGRRCFTGPDSWADAWVFGGQWEVYDNTPRGAAARIRMMLDTGYPETFPADIASGGPLPYTVSPRVEFPPLTVRPVEVSMPLDHIQQRAITETF